MVNIRVATKADVDSFVLRVEDIKEAWTIARADGDVALVATYHASKECWVAEIDSVVVCVFGCVPEGEGAYFWVLFTTIETLPLSFFRRARTFIDETLGRYSFIKNYAHHEKTFIIKLGRWLGFTVDEARPYGEDQELYHCIHKERC